MCVVSGSEVIFDISNVGRAVQVFLAGMGMLQDKTSMLLQKIITTQLYTDTEG